MRLSCSSSLSGSSSSSVLFDNLLGRLNRSEVSSTEPAARPSNHAQRQSAANTEFITHLSPARPALRAVPNNPAASTLWHEFERQAMQTKLSAETRPSTLVARPSTTEPKPSR
jgi:hypothetical protein